MILDHLKYAEKYRGLSKNIATALDWMKNTDIDALEAPQVITVDGDRVFAQIQSYTSMVESEAQFESHRNYIDIQYIQSGREIIPWAPLYTLKAATEYDTEKDLILYNDPPAASSIVLRPGWFAVFFPEDGHEPKCAFDTPEPIGKIVVKVAV